MMQNMELPGLSFAGSAKGRRIVYVVCTNGDKGTNDACVKPEDLAKAREEEQIAAANLLGVRESFSSAISDQGLEDTPEFRKEIGPPSSGCIGLRPLSLLILTDAIFCTGIIE